ncbi:hypothetical protein [Nocardioides marmoraquaticus]
MTGHLRVLVPVAVLTVLAVVAGVLLLLPGGGPEPGAQQPVARPVTPEMLLEPADLADLPGGSRWSVDGTGDNTTGDGINTRCQRARFADPDGEGTLVRRLVRQGEQDRSVLQTVEVSRDSRSASDAFATTLGWFAGCQEARVGLVGAWQVQGLGTRAEVVRLETPADGGRQGRGRQGDLLVGVVRSDRVTVSVVVEGDGRPVGIEPFATLLRRAVTGVCEADAAAFCPDRAEVRRTSLPPSGEARGTLSVTDLPQLPGVEQPWVGTRPVRARPNAAATACDDTAFVGNGAPGARTRTYLVPESDLPDRFGLTQTVGTFRTGARAQEVVDGVVSAMAGCEDDDLSVRLVATEVGSVRGGEVTSYWRLEQEVSDDSTVASWMGVARSGRVVTQVLLTPAGRADLDRAAFAAVLDRARDRLTELEGSR